MNFKAFTKKEIVVQLISFFVPSSFKKRSKYYEVLRFANSVKILHSKGCEIKRVDKNLLRICYDGFCYCLRRYSSDIFVFNQIFINEEYRYVLSLVNKCGLNNANLNIVDCGSNIGLFSLWIFRFISINRLISIESDYNNYEFQKQCLEKSSAYKKIDLLNLAVWSDSCLDMRISSDFRDGLEWGKSVELIDKSFYQDSFVVKSISLNDVLGNYIDGFVHILKIDIEGAEKAIFENESSFDLMLIKTFIIAIEIHEELNCTEFILEKLSKFGFALKTINETTFGYKLI